MKVVIVGGGVIGTSIAYYLARFGVEVVLVERALLASGASGACDRGIILQSKRPGIHLDMALASASLFPRIERELGAGIEYARDGSMILMEREDQLAPLLGLVEARKANGLSVEVLENRQARKIQPFIPPHIPWVLWSPRDAEVNPIRFTYALARAAQGWGARFLTGREVTGFLTRKGHVRGVAFEGGEVTGDRVVLAAGAWTPLIAGKAGLTLPIVPKKGQILVSEPVEPLVTGTLLCASYMSAKYGGGGSHHGVGLSLGQTLAGNLLLGGSREFQGYRTGSTHEVLLAIAGHACRLLPSLKGLGFIRAFAGLRPATPDGLPLLGESSVPGLYIASGHEGDGIALSPITGLLMAQLLTGKDTVIDTRPLGVDRFHGRDAGL